MSEETDQQRREEWYRSGEEVTTEGVDAMIKLDIDPKFNDYSWRAVYAAYCAGYIDGCGHAREDD